MTGTLLDILYKHQNWWNWVNIPYIKKEMDNCAIEYVESLRNYNSNNLYNAINKQIEELIAFNPCNTGDWYEPFNNWNDMDLTLLSDVKEGFLWSIRYYMKNFGYDVKQVNFPEGMIENEQTPDTTPEPQQDTIEAQQGQITPEGNNTTTKPPQVPTINNTDRERWVYGSALKKDYMIKNENNTYKWKKSKALLAYMCGRLYCDDRVISYGTQYERGREKNGKPKRLPNAELKKLFNVTTKEGIGGDRRNNFKNPPTDYGKIDEIFKEVEEKTGIK